jgi:probable F420-dependent oxidoreductase
MSDRNPEFGVVLPQWSEHETPAGVVAVARAAEANGFDAVWRGDHVVFPAEIPEGAPWAEMSTPAYDVFTVLAYVAGATEEIGLGTNVCVVPYRHPVLLANLACSLDALSGGRFEFGVGVGVHRSEFEVLDVPYRERGSRTDEFLRLFERVVAEPELAFDGPHHSFGETGFRPRPATEGGPPIWVGGDSAAAVRRTARFGDGWTLFQKPPAEVRAARERLVAAWDEQDRRGRPGLAVPVPTRVGSDHDLEAEGAFVGDPASIADAVRRYVDVGATRINLDFRGLPIDARVDQLEAFAERVLPRV